MNLVGDKHLAEFAAPNKGSEGTKNGRSLANTNGFISNCGAANKPRMFAGINGVNGILKSDLEFFGSDSVILTIWSSN